jgi:hypothetical protein
LSSVTHVPRTLPSFSLLLAHGVKHDWYQYRFGKFDNKNLL